MTDPSRILGIILARGGSKRLPGKNVRSLAGKPLIAWTIDVARACPRIGRVLVSSDDAQIIDASRAAGAEVPFTRPPELSGDDARPIDAIFHALDMLDTPIDIVVLLQPTSPLRRLTDVEACLSMVLDEGAPSAIAVSPVDKGPHYYGALDAQGLFTQADVFNRHRTSGDPVIINGACYVARTEALRAHEGFVMPGTRAHVMSPYHSVDIDTIEDFVIAEALLALRKREQ
ncbi:MAG: acylneuraminate cytidylyltransferase family protein [Neomegalonema sp.]|nr:acylneuraminate cytidylyltransferase family protein [Neomegalonema sp.]